MMCPMVVWTFGRQATRATDVWATWMFEDTTVADRGEAWRQR